MRAIAALLLAFLAGCATDYQATGFTGGFSETYLAADLVRVRFQGNGYTRAERAQDFCMMRAAELATKAGFRYCAVLDENTARTAHNITTPGTAQTYGSAQVTGNRVAYSQTTNYMPGQTVTLYKPEVGLVVKFLPAPHPDLLCLEAPFVIKSIQAKYKMAAPHPAR
jgi:hypothetical protein